MKKIILILLFGLINVCSADLFGQTVSLSIVGIDFIESSNQTRTSDTTFNLTCSLRKADSISVKKIMQSDTLYFFVSEIFKNTNKHADSIAKFNYVSIERFKIIFLKGELINEHNYIGNKISTKELFKSFEQKQNILDYKMIIENLYAKDTTDTTRMLSPHSFILTE